MLVTNSSSQHFLQKLRTSKFRNLVWPIKSTELVKFLPMALLMFTILLNQNVVRGIKDSLIVTKVGPEAISFIKLWCEMPAGILFVLIYTKMCNIMTTEQIFRRIVIFFVSFFVLFAFVIFPNSHNFHPDPAKVLYYIQSYSNFKWFIILWGNWSYILFYVMGELWPVIVFSLLYWQLANKVTATEEASRFYSFFSLFGQTNLLISGSIIVYFSSGIHYFSSWFEGAAPTEMMMKSLMLIVLVSGIACLLLHAFIEKTIVKHLPRTNHQVLKLSLRESLKMVLSSKYLGLIAIAMLGYSMSINLLEGLWMAKVRELYPSAELFIQFQGKVLFLTGCFTLFGALIGSTIIRRFGWFTAAITTPLMIGIPGVVFFTSIITQKYASILGNFSHTDILYFIILLGALQNILGKGTKYSLFDATKEMTYIPLNNELKTKGKAAVDIMGAKLGKSSGALIQFLAFTIYPHCSYDDITGFLLSFFITILVLWVAAIKVLAIDYNKLVNLPAQ